MSRQVAGLGYYHYRPLGFRRLLRRLRGRRIRLALLTGRPYRGTLLGLRGRRIGLTLLGGRSIYLPIRRISYVIPI